MTPIEASKDINEKAVFSSIEDKTGKRKPPLHMSQLFETADIEKILVKAMVQFGVEKFLK